MSRSQPVQTLRCVREGCHGTRLIGRLLCKLCWWRTPPELQEAWKEAGEAKDRATQAHLAVLTAEVLVAADELGAFWGRILLRGWRGWPRVGPVTCMDCGQKWESPHGLDLVGDPRCCGKLRWQRLYKLVDGWPGAANG